eukprot:2642904-Amphidinium_carterae.1
MRFLFGSAILAYAVKPESIDRLGHTIDPQMGAGHGHLDHSNFHGRSAFESRARWNVAKKVRPQLLPVDAFIQDTPRLVDVAASSKPIDSRVEVLQGTRQRCPSLHLMVGMHVQACVPNRLAALGMRTRLPTCGHEWPTMDSLIKDEAVPGRPPPGKGRSWVAAKITSVRRDAVTVSIGQGNAEVRRIVSMAEIFCPRPSAKRLSAPPAFSAAPEHGQPEDWIWNLAKGEAVEVLLHKPCKTWVPAVLTSVTSSALVVSFFRDGDEIRKVLPRTSKELRPPLLASFGGARELPVAEQNSEPPTPGASQVDKSQRVSCCSSKGNMAKRRRSSMRYKRGSGQWRSHKAKPTRRRASCEHCGQELSLPALLQGLRAEVYLIQDEQIWAPAIITQASPAVVRVGVSLLHTNEAAAHWRAILKDSMLSERSAGAQRNVSVQTTTPNVGATHLDSVSWQTGDNAEVYSSRLNAWVPATIREVTTKEVRVKVNAPNGLWWLQSCPLTSPEIRRLHDVAMT